MNIVIRKCLLAAVLTVLAAFLTTGCATEHRFIKKTAFKDTNQIVIEFAGPVDEAWAKNPSHYSVYEKPDPDIKLKIQTITLSPDRKTVALTFADPLNQNQPHVLTATGITSEGKSLGTAILSVKKVYLGYLFSILIGAMIINNFVFTKYLGLCVFFGTSQKKSTAVGMGITFTIVIVVSAMMAWFLYQFVLRPYRLNFLQIVVFIGLVSLSVQAVDTILRKVNPMLFKAFGVYLVLVIANCIIIAVPLILADNEYNALESLMLALGAGLGFLIALFLMSSVRERLELARVPPTYRGLPIAFVVAGLFALAFLGFSGMSIF
ncbi:MAG: NADH-quinone reductase [Deltaproteobacteria bacterium]|nr:NADH-quinone reductase [Deltaproteobacteria bacterium]